MIYATLVWAHLLGIALGGAAAFGHPVVGMVGDRMPDARPALSRVAEGLGRVGHAGLGLLILSGAGLIAMAHDITAMPTAFWVKMALVAVLVVNISIAKRSARRADAGDAAAAARMPVLAMIGAGLMLALLAAGVAAFR